ncbi:hypothetical protein PMIN03_012547 [Paraphaeosphaeria minitans]
MMTTQLLSSFCVNKLPCSQLPFTRLSTLRMEPEAVSKAIVSSLQTQTPTRVAVLLKKRSPLYSSSPDAVVSTTCATLNASCDYKLLVIQKWPQFTVLVFDISNSAYDFSTAHQKANIPVLHFDYGSQHTSYKWPSSDFQNLINDQVAKMHNLNGWDRRPPYIEDHTSSEPRTYENPRDTSML